MSKNKNPLKDLDLFLKQQAASFVNPTPLSEKIQVEAPAEITTSAKTEETILQSLERMMDQNPSALYDMLIEAAERKPSAERTMLINTALYLKNTANLPAPKESGVLRTGQANWKEAIKQYWRNKSY